MTTSTTALRTTLDRVDRERKRSRLLLFSLLAMTLAFWGAMIFLKDDHKGLTFGLAAVMGSAYVAGMMSVKTSHDNTQSILKAIELLASEKH